MGNEIILEIEGVYEPTLPTYEEIVLFLSVIECIKYCSDGLIDSVAE